MLTSCAADLNSFTLVDWVQFRLQYLEVTRQVCKLWQEFYIWQFSVCLKCIFLTLGHCFITPLWTMRLIKQCCFSVNFFTQVYIFIFIIKKMLFWHLYTITSQWSLINNRMCLQLILLCGLYEYFHAVISSVGVAYIKVLTFFIRFFPLMPKPKE